jgi:hypothetical protein
VHRYEGTSNQFLGDGCMALVGVPIVHADQAPEVGQTYAPAPRLCQHLADPRQFFPALRGLSGYYNVRTEYQTACTPGERLLALVQ